VEELVQYWLPEIRFHQKEKFHPISLEAVFTMVQDVFATLPESAREEWRVQKFVRAGPIAGEVVPFDPPVVYAPDGLVGNRPAVRVLAQGSSAIQALELPEVGSSARVTHGASFRRSDQFFGARITFGDGNVPSAGDPFRPRASITVMAALLNLLDLLKYELTTEAADGYPPDGLRGGFDISSSLFRPVVSQPPPLLPHVRRQVLLEMIAAHEAGDPIPPPEPPHGWEIDRVAWDAVTRYTFMEFYFFYAYNDWERYQTTPFDNEHEGDDEGCCLVFDRNVINAAVAGNGPDALLRAVPHSIITSVHEEWQNADLFRFIPTPVPQPEDPERLPREDVDVTVYVAGGSHATYLSPGNHDLVDFGDTFGLIGSSSLASFLLPIPVVLVLAIIVCIIDHFVDTEDFTSDDGVRTGPEDIVGDHPTAAGCTLMVLPMSADNHIYQPANVDLLRLRAFPGKWGAHDGPIDTSPPFKAKTGRYFRKLIEKL
jgi:hypothetical protein